MNEFFELVHSGQSASVVFILDVVIFFAMVIVIRSVLFLIGYRATELIDNINRGGRPPKYLKSEGSPIQSRKGPVNVVRPTRDTTDKKAQ